MKIEKCFVKFIGFSYKPTPVWNQKGQVSFGYKRIPPFLIVYLWFFRIDFDLWFLNHNCKKQFGSRSEDYTVIYGGLLKKRLEVTWGEL